VCVCVCVCMCVCMCARKCVGVCARWHTCINHSFFFFYDIISLYLDDLLGSWYFDASFSSWYLFIGSLSLVVSRLGDIFINH